MSEHTTPTGLWLYAVARGFDPAPLEDLRGVAGAPVRDVRVRDEDTREELSAVVSPVSLDEFGEQALRRNLEDLDWLSATARAHDAVVAAVSAAATAAVPLRLATVSFDEDRVRDLVTRNRAEFVTTLNALTGRTEWGVKVYTDPGRLAPASTTASAESSSGGAGAAYLRRRKAALSARETGEQVAAEHAERLHARLAGAAVADRRHPPQDPKLSGERAHMVLNGAYLVDDDRAAAFAELVRELDAEHDAVRVELTGPWPPYSFAAVGQAAERAPQQAEQP
ncbi:GvpL/GvpF family gas vesicle protein [Saccharomonospora xinjiangensis]|uniref:GvpL/GvpF family gas vesicle protein n=1 Tax=Saccharomonospora xinjiangensis TaxID=75294 RepID=UPI00106F0D4E|nr:GvpL/GvpF family gas vesicle protein [Saccharomonospora xinjiangensis]QBQ60253.1 Gas vesicle synthesis protein GvpL/GvpF [Saccharomonospora xinjiangensis]